ncbi:hypothetical protein BGZ99_009550 [Dissophora globulifera]|uniref:ER-bound oxygenase mpaB/mpaB'/Rubber oxygenase catalytic domain-containing protein n=1 Tax=Dissophora globulifera TaxID=979702 RepID=A0A9P6RQL9_9FUNG|nr:hypothetical protein BGZ99_009550 [Dissophora globulifera]
MLGNFASSLISGNTVLPTIYNALTSSSSSIHRGATTIAPIALLILKCFAIALVPYMAVVRKRRFQGINKLLKKYPDQTLPLRDLRVAEEVYTRSFGYDFPFMMNFAVGLSVLKTSSIPRITKIQVATRETVDRGPKRAEDTNDILGEILDGPLRREARRFVQDEVDLKTGAVTTRARKSTPAAEDIDNDRAEDEARAQAAIERMNFIHSHYKIQQNDYLYNLSMFATECFYWIEHFDFRPLTDLEKNAILGIWTDIARKMGIEYVPATVQELVDWTEEYEAEHQVYASTNPMVANSSISLLQDMFTSPAAKARVKKFFSAIINPRLRKALGWEEPSQFAVRLCTSLLWIRGAFVKHLMLPKSVPAVRTALTATVFEESKGDDPRQSSAAGCPFTGGKRYIPRFNDLPPVYNLGYRIEELGPSRFFGKGPGAGACPVVGANLATL